MYTYILKLWEGIGVNVDHEISYNTWLAKM